MYYRLVSQRQSLNCCLDRFIEWLIELNIRYIQAGCTVFGWELTPGPYKLNYESCHCQRIRKMKLTPFIFQDLYSFTTLEGILVDKIRNYITRTCQRMLSLASKKRRRKEGKNPENECL